jgi:cytochrome c oxidase subunit II
VQSDPLDFCVRRAPAGKAVSALGYLLLAGCSGAQSALDPSGSGARAIYWVWLLFFCTGTGVLAVVMAGFAGALLRRRYASADAPPTMPPAPATERRLDRLLQAAVALTVAILLMFTAASYSVGTTLFYAPRNPVEIELTGHRWWWEVRYLGSDLASANEIHVPLGKPVRLTLRSDDVIHSFWAPNLHGKMDLIPGQTNHLVFTAERAGVYRGQCAEFCGQQHAFMALYVVAAPEAEFRRWRERQERPAAEPTNDTEKHGRQVFADKCAVCHAIRGFKEEGTVGPDLTHVAGRLSIGAGRLPNTRAARAGWIVDAPQLKPNVYMPSFRLPSEDLQALLGYIDTLR